jgi:ABC-2 type transport system permease protein
MNLVRAEFSRLISRRFVQVMVIALVVAFGFTVLSVLSSSSTPTEQMWTEARAQAREERANLIMYRRDCQAAQDPQTPDSVRERYPKDCSTINPDNIRAESYLYGVFNFRKSIDGLVGFLTAYLAFFGFLVAASFIGAEMRSGGMTNLLLWRPQRTTVLATKLGVALGGIAALSTVFTVVYVGTFWAIAHFSGFVGILEDGFWGDLALLSLRGIVVALVASAIAFAIAAIAKHTAAALGVLVGYVVLWEGGGRIVLDVIGLGSTEPWFGSTYIGAWMIGKLSYDSCGRSYYDSFNMGWEACQRYVYLWHGALVMAVVAGLFLAGAFINFRRKDLA